MSRLLNPIAAASAAMRKSVRRRVVQKVLAKTSKPAYDREFMVFMNSLPMSVEDNSNPGKMESLRTAQKSLDAAIQDAAAHSAQDYVSYRMKNLSEVAATKRRRRRNGIGRGRFNLNKVM